MQQPLVYTRSEVAFGMYHGSVTTHWSLIEAVRVLLPVQEGKVFDFDVLNVYVNAYFIHFHAAMGLIMAHTGA